MRMFTQIWDWFTEPHNFIGGIIATVLGYFLPIRNIIHLILLLFVIDVVIGYIKAHKLTGVNFKPKIVWQKTIPRMIFVLILIILTFLWDDVFKQNFVKTYHLIGWFVSGLLIVSIVENMYEITNWHIFTLLGNIIEKHIKTKIEETEKLEENEKKAKKKGG